MINLLNRVLIKIAVGYLRRGRTRLSVAARVRGGWGVPPTAGGYTKLISSTLQDLCTLPVYWYPGNRDVAVFFGLW